MAAGSIPSLDIYHEAINIGKKEVSRVSEALLGDPEDYAFETPEEWEYKRQAVRNLLRPARLLRAEVLVYAEVLRVQRYAGLKSVDEEHVDELMDYMWEVFPRSSRKHVITAPTLPAQIKRPTSHIEVLGIGASQDAMQERVLAKAALVNFYQLAEVPDDIWLDDESVTSAWLARAIPGNDSDLYQLDVTLEENPDLLPEETEYGGVKIVPNPHR